MKKLIAVITIAAALVAPALAQQTYTKNADGSFTPVVLSTNSSGPFLSGPGMDLLSNLSSATNWGAATFGIYMPSSSGHKASMGAGAIFLYNINPYMATGLGIDWLDNQTTMPSGQFQLQLPISVGGTNGLLVTPFAFTGIATPVAGMGNDNGSVVGIFGAGLDVKIYGGFGAFYAIEQRTGQPALWNIAGLRYSKAL